jgi:NAD+ diphosphatase
MPFEKSSKGIRTPDKVNSDSLYFVFSEGMLLLEKNEKGEYSLPVAEDFKKRNLKFESLIYLRKYEKKSCYGGELSEERGFGENIVACKLRKTYYLIGLELFQIAGYAFHITNWYKNSRFCGRCGNEMENMKKEWAKICPQCKLVNYPTISPAVIVAVVKNDTILLANAERFSKDLYSVLAGFVEVGENLEDCIKREIKEEVGIEVKNINYFGSQHWPFHDSLMIAFTAEHSKGEVLIDKEEISDAGWFKADGLPVIPGKPSIARDLIDWFIETRS